jgi:hypothetical protein
MTSLFEATRRIVKVQKVRSAPFLLEEDAQGSQCPPVMVKHRAACWALRLADGDCLPLLAELEKDRSVRKLPDYLLFIEPDEGASVDMLLVICELKSSATGAEAALRQVQLGKLLAEYLLRLASFDLGRPKPPKVYPCGLIISPDLPPNLRFKGRTRPGKIDIPWIHDNLSEMRMYHAPAGGEIHLDSLFS